MRILSPLKKILFFLILFILTSHLSAQTQNLTVTQDAKFEQLLNEKRKLNPNLTYNDRYRIQIFNGISETAKKTFSEFKQEYNTVDGTIVFNTPNYKVWVGNFRTRMEAEHYLVEIKNNYKNVFLIKPSK
ncbi:SPOR domain-containing protein [Flavobacterium sp. N3904]|uniref:SPOR domain-containing protein n=1 Tax=Flavobacterium sp. N3904 TaxID=2986835 RepID=UPI0022258FC5|nr:SPOR domain-containing protein [Flavobacterium sp. N3904]